MAIVPWATDPSAEGTAVVEPQDGAFRVARPIALAFFDGVDGKFPVVEFFALEQELRAFLLVRSADPDHLAFVAGGKEFRVPVIEFAVLVRDVVGWDPS